ncbi:MAG: rhodanese-like domain-containing protein [Clostridia bacterium]|nr:rhodanese-like domain-containing protein [Clostridia bacterium]
MNRRTAVAFVVLVLMFSFFSCGKEEPVMDTPEMTYKRITMSEAEEIFKTGGEYIILDVRRDDEFREGHIPGAVNIPNEVIGEEAEKILTDKNAVIYVYCRSGNRSKQASEKLYDMGYTDIIEFGGILDWKGDIEK